MWDTPVASIDLSSCGIRLDRLADHVVAPQQLAWQGARALVVRKGHGAIDERIAQPGELLDQATLTPWEVGREDGLVVQVAEGVSKLLIPYQRGRPNS